MRTIVINTGTELLLGEVLNTHLTFLARELFTLGLRIDRQITVPDGPAIHSALAETFGRADLVFVTGGLGPTTDDITRDVAAELLRLELRHDPGVMAIVTSRFRKFRVEVTQRVARQADVPEGAQVLPNKNGTAPGLYLRANLNLKISSPHLFLLPGPPRELQPMFKEFVLPILSTLRSNEAVSERRTYRVTGMGESAVENLIGDKLLAIPGLELGYCARPGEVDVRLIGADAALDQAEAIVTSALGHFIFSRGGENLEEVIVNILTTRSETIATAESCTGGLLAHRVTNIPGASAVFRAGYVAYANDSKITFLGVDARFLRENGAVSEATARAMADGARERTNATYALATTGIAGPGGGTETKPVGTVYIALASEHANTLVRQLCFPVDRETFKQLASQAALNLLREQLL
ncbi:MAG: competence/damage-inducible protein A [Verrucomicrobiota bacterium]